jgi:hypothetical protein
MQKEQARPAFKDKTMVKEGPARPQGKTIQKEQARPAFKD